MKLFQHSLRGLVVLGLGPLYQSTGQRYPINRKNALIQFILYSATGLCCAYLLYKANSFSEFAMSVYITTSFVLVAIVYSLCIWKNHIICELLTEFERIINESEWTCAIHAIEKNFILIHQCTYLFCHFRIKISSIDGTLHWNEWNCGKMRPIHRFCDHEIHIERRNVPKSFLLLVSVLCDGFRAGRFRITVSILVALYFVRHTYIWYAVTLCVFGTIQLLYRMPFDWKNPIAYIVASFIEYISLRYLYIVLSALMSLHLGAYLMATSFIQDAQNDIRSINKIAKSKKKQSQLSTKFHETIQAHTQIKQLSWNNFDLQLICWANWSSHWSACIVYELCHCC